MSLPLRAGFVLGGILAIQAILFWPSLCGHRVLLPLNLLRVNYLPGAAKDTSSVPESRALVDEVIQFEPSRRFAAEELLAGRLPLWDPYSYCGVPNAVFPLYSYTNLLYYCWPAPYSHAWIQVLKSLIAGAGAYLFFRISLRASFWPAAIGAWMYPATAFFMVWQGFYLSGTVALYPWMMFFVDRAVCRRGRFWGPALSLTTALLLTAGAFDIAGQVLLVSGLFALYRLASHYGPRRWRKAVRPALLLVTAWSLGFAIAAPYLLSLVDYLPTGARVIKRAKGSEERPPVGLKALPQVFLPLTYGDESSHSLYLLPGSLLESAAAGHVGLFAVLAVAPLAFTRRLLRGVSFFWLVQMVLGLAWLLDLPLAVQLLRLPGLNFMSFNRFSFATGFAALALTVQGLEVLRRGVPPRRVWYAIPVLALLALAVWCFDRAVSPSDSLLVEVEKLAARRPGNVALRDRVLDCKRTLAQYHYQGLALCVLGLAAWLCYWNGFRRRWLPLAFGLLCLGELVPFAASINPQCDVSLYYPRLSIVEMLHEQPPGRTLGLGCFPPALSHITHLPDVRGYDAVDPLRLVELLDTARDNRFSCPPYALTMNYVPVGRRTQDGQYHLPGVLNMLSLRYVIGHDPAPSWLRPALHAGGFWVWENGEALPRAYVPTSIQAAPKGSRLLQILANESFDPSQIAYVEDPPPLPPSCRGRAAIVADAPMHLRLELDMQTPGLVVLSDLWYQGWQATLNGEPVPILRVNHALRGIVAPEGKSTLVFDYHPRGFKHGLQLAAAGGVLLLLWLAWGCLAWIPRAAFRRPSSGRETPGRSFAPLGRGPGKGDR